MTPVTSSRLPLFFFFSLTSFLLLIGYLIWPWCYAAWIWRISTIHISTSSPGNPTSTSSVPRIIHQTWRDPHTMPASWQQASNSCRHLHRNYDYRFWTDDDARRLIAREYPQLLATFDAYPYDIQRADMIRLVVLYIFGGIYLDLDIICLQSLDHLRSFQFVLPRTRPVGLSNDFIIAQPKHPFLLQVLDNLPKYQRRFFTKYSTVMFSTGPMFLTHQASLFSNRSSIEVLSEELYGKYIHNSSRALFRHLKASSWHGNDAMIIKWIYRRRKMFLLSSMSLLLLTFALIYCLRHRHTIADLIAAHRSSVQLNVEKRAWHDGSLLPKLV